LGSGLFFSPALLKGSPAEKIVVGIMGTNSRGLFLSKAFASLPNVEVGFVCDPDQKVLDKTVNVIQKETGKYPQAFTDIRKLLESKELDALIVAAPDHWHTPAAIMAMQAGKHVYVEKPCSHNPGEGELLVEATKRYKKYVQMGSQRRSFQNVQQMIQELQDDIIGKVYYAKGWYVNNRASIGIGKKTAVPNHLNFDLWQGPAPRKMFQDNLIHYNWHWFWHWGTGESLNNGTHELDVIRWGLGVSYPDSVSSSGGRFHFQDDWETPDTQTINFTFPGGKACTWEGRSCNGFPIEGHGRGVVFYGTNGTIVYPGNNSYQVFSPGGKLLKEVIDDTPFDATNTVSPMEQLEKLHLDNFCQSIRGKTTLAAPILEGHRSTLLPQLGNISYRTKSTLVCNPENGHILNNPEASKLWSRTYEPGWEIKV